MIIGLIALLVMGVILIALTLMISWWMNERMDNRELDSDSDVHLYVPSWCRRRWSNNRNDMEGEEK